VLRAVLDTNILARGLVAAPTTAVGFIVESWHGSLFQLVVSRHVLDELEEALAKPYFTQRVPGEAILRYLVEIRDHAVLTSITVDVVAATKHHEDDLVLAAARSAGAHYLVTGDEGLRAVARYEDVVVLGPGEFCQILRDLQRSDR